jgi:glycerol-3-phosphate dehydrogenase
VVGSIAGCRPLIGSPGGKTVELKRNHEIDVAPDGLITIVGGKLTTSRHMAEQTVDVAAKLLGRKRACSTKSAFYLAPPATIRRQFSLPAGSPPTSASVMAPKPILSATSSTPTRR